MSEKRIFLNWTIKQMESEIRRERKDSTDIDFLHIYFYLHFCKEQEALESVTSLICFFLFVTSISFLIFFFIAQSPYRKYSWFPRTAVLLLYYQSFKSGYYFKSISLIFCFHTIAGRLILLI